MKFSKLANYLSELEATSLRLKMTEILAKLFSESGENEIGKVCYLVLGQLAPKYVGLEFNMAEKMILRVLGHSLKMEGKKVLAAYKESGDLGNVVLKFKTKGTDLRETVESIYNQLVDIAKENGEGSVERKINKLAGLINKVDSQSAKYIIRMPVGKLRLGFSDMTILDALSWMNSGNKDLRPKLEKAFNVLADIGKIAQVFKTSGIKGIEKIQSEVGVPIRMAKSERLPGPKEILEKLQGQCALEPKYDGFRCQIHLDKQRTEDRKLKTETMELFADKKQKYFCQIFSRNLENTTHMFPDLIEAVYDLKVQNVILDGEAIAFNPQTGKFLPFQETVQRKRKHGVFEAAKKFPLRIFVFDVLMLDGKSLLNVPFKSRRQILEKLMTESNLQNDSRLKLTEQKIVTRPEEFENFFKEVANEGLEGLMAKKLDSIYQAGARNYNWVKYKVGMRSDLADTIDGVVMGYYQGKGKRTGFGIGAFLIGVPDKGRFLTVSKIGTGLTDEQWREMKIRCKKRETNNMPKEYLVHKNIAPDVWCMPKIVVEIEADTITKSPIHTAGLALRFPRLKNFRDDKNPDQGTSLKELKKIAKI